METKRCSKCHYVKSLAEFYFHKSGINIGKHFSKCIQCSKDSVKQWALDNPERRDDYQKQWRKSHPGNTAKHNHKTGKQRPFTEAKDCSLYFGVYVAERALSRFFDHIERMPYGNPSFDFRCGRGYLIDAKSACLTQEGTKSPRWWFNIKKNTVPDYFLCIGFDNRESLDPMHVWLVPREILNNRVGFGITNTQKGLRKWEKYEKPLDRVNTCCGAIKEEISS
jgi:hypothetical protein